MDKATVGVQMEWQGWRGGRGLGFSVIPLKEVRNPEFCASGYLILFCPLNLLKGVILHRKFSMYVCT